MKHAIAGLGLALALAGCAAGGSPVSSLAQFTVGDVAGAQALAVAGGDRTGATCWGAMLPVARAAGAGAIGIASGVELYRVVMIGAQGPCAPIVMPILMRLNAAGLLAAGAGVPIP